LTTVGNGYILYIEGCEKPSPIKHLNQIKIMTTQKLVQKLNSNVASVRKFSLTRGMYVAKFTDIEHELFATESGIVAYKFESHGNPSLMLFVGKSNKPLIHCRFHSVESRELKINSIVQNVENDSKRKAKRKLVSEQPSTLVVGDILYTSWGYDQTNIDFFQVVKTSGKRTVELMRIHAARVESNSDYSDTLMPVKDSFITEGYQSQENGTYRVKNGTYVSFNGYKSGSLWDGKPKYQTAAGYGH